MNTSRAKTVVGLFTLALGTGWACSNPVAGHSSETNWFDTCEVDGDCSVGHCLCGVCTESCTEDSNCPGVYTCAGSDSGAFTRLCKGASSAPAGVCLQGCGSGSACAAGFECESDACVPKARVASNAVNTGTGGTTSNAEQTLSSVSWISSMQYTNTGNDSPPLWGQCLYRPLPIDSKGQVSSCTVMAYRTDSPDCRCDEAGFGVPAPETLRATTDTLRQRGECDVDGRPSCDDFCGCELLQKTGSDLETCRQQDSPLTDGAGWCYIDPDRASGNPALVAKCPSTQRGVLRVSGVPNQQLLIACTETTATSPRAGVTPGAMGDPCTPQDEFSPNFNGFRETEVNIESGSPSCSTGICLTANFRGRVSCPYGQPAVTIDGVPRVDPALAPDERCYLPGTSHEPANEVKVAVDPQLLARSPEKSVYCSCRCDGPGDGPFCPCPSGFECAHLVDTYGAVEGGQLAGSYCIKSGTNVPDPTKIDQTECQIRGVTRAPRPEGCGDP